MHLGLAATLTLVATSALVALPSTAAADRVRGGGPTEDPIAAHLEALDQCVGAEEAVVALGERWEAVMAEASWDPAATGPRRFSERVAPGLRRAALHRRTPRAARHLVLQLLGQLRHPPAGPMFARMLSSDRCPAEWIAIAADGLARLDTPEAERALADALVASVPGSGAPHREAWALCNGVARVSSEGASPEVRSAVARLFLFAPQIAVESCMPLVRSLPGAAELARRVLDGDRWPEPVDGPDPRDMDMLGPYGRGGALVLIGELGTDDALDRLAEGIADASDGAEPTRDGAVQGLATLGGPRARELLRDALRDPRRRTPRIAHSLLRLGDVPAAPLLRDVALDGEVLVEMRMSAANAWSLLVGGRRNLVRDWERDLAEAPPFGTPFEALDARMAALVRRLVVAERCRVREECWVEALVSDDDQVAGRAFWQLSRTAVVDEPEVAPLLAETAARTLATTPPNENHDRVAGAVALLARIDPAVARPHRAVVRRARFAWEGRTNPMGLPFDIPLALGQLARRLSP